MGCEGRAVAGDLVHAGARVLMQDFTGVGPAIVDLAAMRDAMQDMSGDPSRINPLQPAELVIDHSIQVDEFATRLRVQATTPRARVRAQQGEVCVSFAGARRRFHKLQAWYRPTPGICHQVNLEYLASVVYTR